MELCRNLAYFIELMSILVEISTGLDGDIVIKSIPYKDIVDKLQTGDIVLFHGILRESILIQAIEGSIWSHVGMVVRIPGFDYPLLWESNILVNLEDVELHEAKKGPMLVPLYDRIKTDLENMDDVMFAVRYLVF